MVTLTTKPVSPAALDLVKHFEGLFLNAYICPAGKPTIGWGHTKGVKMGQRISRQQAEEFLAADMAEAADAVDRLVSVPLTDNQRGALASFAFNLGPTNLAGSTLLRLLNAGASLESIGEQFGRWVNATVNGKKTQLPGLVARRAAEKALFLGATK